MVEHSVKVPRNYKIATNIFKKVASEGGSVKTLLYDPKLRHFRTDVLYALVTETIKRSSALDKIFESTEIFVKEPRLDPWLAKVLTVELLYGKKTFPGKSKPESTIMSYKEEFEKYLAENEDSTEQKDIRRPRYVRINTNLISTSDCIRHFQDEEYRFIRCTSASYDDYLQQVRGLQQYDFMQDFHIKSMLVFYPGTKFHCHQLYLENKIVLQDKATAMAVHLLAPPAGSVVLDMCAAPGMKTTHIAAHVRNQGTIYAVERSEARYKTLCDMVQKTGSTCVRTLHQDALAIRRGDLEDVEYVLLDPSCSGSGMEVSLHNYVETARLAKLTSLQEKFLKHAMNVFPNAKRIVYSTCSLFPEENERVVSNVINNSRTKWRVQNVKELLKGQWNNFGSGMFGSVGTRCMYARPEDDLTTGFFLACIDRDFTGRDRSKKQEEEIALSAGDQNKKDMSAKIEEHQAKNEGKKTKKERMNDEIIRMNASTDLLKLNGTADQLTGNQLEDGSSSKKSKPHNKKKKQEKIGQTSDNIIDDNDSDNQEDKNKESNNKTKIKKSSDPLTKNNESATKEDSNNLKVKKKKKNKQNSDVDESALELETSNQHDYKECIVMKSDELSNVVDSKKKKKRDIDTEALSVTENSVDDKIESKDTKHKKKKRKHEADSANLTEGIHNVNEVAISEVEIPAKKHKKRNKDQ